MYRNDIRQRKLAAIARINSVGDVPFGDQFNTSESQIDKKGVVLIPYRNREHHLVQFLPIINQYFSSEKIFLIEQCDNMPFNRGALFNVGFIEIESECDYFVFHDIDLIPQPGKVDYSYCEYPTHISAYCGQFDFKLPYQNIFGGVVIINKEHFRNVNGFPSSFKGWGCEDDMLYKSFVAKRIAVKRKHCWFDSLHHQRNFDQAQYQQNLAKLNRGRNFFDGLTSCQYTVLSREIKEQYVHIKIRLEV